MTQAQKQLVKTARRACKARGISATSKRTNVLAVLLDQNKAVSAYELADCYEQTFNQPIPVITVYRVLDFFQSEHLVHKLETANKFIACNHANREHDHSPSQFLICNGCQKVEELSMSEAKFNELKQTIEQAGYYLTNTQLEMKCICQVCYDKESPTESN